MITSQKKELRSLYRQIRKDASNDTADFQIMQRVITEKRILDADVVLLFASVGTEPSTREIASFLFRHNIKTAFPRCLENNEMIFRCVNSEEQLIKGKYDIPEPSTDEVPVLTEKSVCIVPGLAFTLKGERLGYGGGYYDRFFEKYPFICKIAIAYEACIAESLVTDIHDFKVDALITEERMVLCNE